MTLTTESNDKRIECFYDSERSKDYFELTLENEHGCLVSNMISRHDVPELIHALEYFDRMMKLTTGR